MPSIGTSTLKQLVDGFLPHIYPTVANVQSGHEPTSVIVYGIKKATESGDRNINTQLNSLKFSDLVQALAGYKFEVTRYDNGNPGASSVYSVGIQSTDSSMVGSLSIAQIVQLLGQNPVTVTLSGGQPKSYTITGTPDTSEQNSELSTGIGPLGAKYVFLLKKLYKFKVTPLDATNRPTGGPSIDYTIDGNKTFSE